MSVMNRNVIEYIYCSYNECNEQKLENNFLLPVTKSPNPIVVREMKAK